MNNEEITKYVLGFLFTEDKKQVVLIQKQKPEWQKGLLNGVGGKIKNDESPYNAMIREFEEETGVKTNNWIKFCEMKSSTFEVICFKLFNTTYFNESKTIELEKIFKINVNEVNKENTISNILWLIYLALDEYPPIQPVVYYQ